MFKNIALHGTYISSKQWSVSKMKSPYDIKFLAIIQVIYKRDNVCYFKNKIVISLRKAFVGFQWTRLKLCTKICSRNLTNGLSLRAK
jgi:hypothetical protein